MAITTPSPPELEIFSTGTYCSVSLDGHFQDVRAKRLAVDAGNGVCDEVSPLGWDGERVGQHVQVRAMTSCTSRPCLCTRASARPRGFVSPDPVRLADIVVRAI